MAKGNHLEIERKFVLQRLPARDLLGEGVRIRQFYLPGDAGEIRVRQAGSRFFLTVKSDGDLVRTEWEVELPEWAFNLFCERAGARGIEKTRFTVLHGRDMLLVDAYDAPVEGLVTLECEFDSESAARTFQCPSWAKQAFEVTTDPRYKNRALALGNDPRAGGDG